jgi:hypothetical protein
VNLRALRLLPLAALPLVVALAQQQPRGARDRDDESGGSGPSQSRFGGPSFPATALLADEARERADPFLLPLEGGRVLLGCLEYEVGVGDRVALRELLPDGKPKQPDAPMHANATPAAIVRPLGALDGAGRLNVVWTDVAGGRAQLVLARGNSFGFAPPVPLTDPAAPCRNAELAKAKDGTLWLAWEQWRPREGASAAGSFDVVVAPIADKGLGEKVVVGASRGSDLDPVLAFRPDGKLAVAWCRFGGRDYEIALRLLDPATGALSDEWNVSADAASDDVHPALAATPGGELWLAWDRIEDPDRGRSTPGENRIACSVRVASVTLPADAEGAAPVVSLAPLRADAPFESLSGGTPKLLALADGRVQLALRFLARQGPGGRAYGFPLLTATIDGTGVGPLSMVAESAGAPQEPVIAASGDAVVVAWQQDHRLECDTGTLMRKIPPNHFNRLAQQAVVLTGSLAPSGIGVARVAPSGSGAAAASAPRAGKLEPAHFHPSGDPLADPFVSGDEHFVVTAGDEAKPAKWNVYWGDLHRHSSVSRCTRGFEPGAPDRWTFGRDVALYDFMALTDHSCQVDALGWWQLEKTGLLAANPGFVALAGFEWSTGFHGHQNVILRGNLRPFLSSTYPRLATPADLYRALGSQDAFAIPHHPADVARKVDFTECDPKLVRLVELYQAQRGSYEFDGCFKQSRQAHAVGSFATDALKLGLKVGFIASSDHGEGTSYACVLAEALDRGHVFDALRARRTYGATTKGILVDFRVDGRVMGEELEARGSSAKASLRVRGAKELAEVIVFRNGEPWQVLGRGPPDGPEAAARPAEVTLQLELARPTAPRAADWTVRVEPLAAGAVTMKPWFELPRYARDDLGPDRPEWKAAAGGVSHLWKGSYAGHWEPIYSRLRLSGPRDAKVRLVAEASDGSPGQQVELSLGELASGKARVGGDSPLGAWTISCKESFDAAVDLSKGLGVRELTKEWTDDALPAGTTWYYARLIQVDGEMAWSSPIWVTRK